MFVPDATAFVEPLRTLVNTAHLGEDVDALLHLLCLNPDGTVTARPATPDYVTRSRTGEGQIMTALNYAVTLAPHHQELGPVVAVALTYYGEHAQTALGGRALPPSPMWDMAPHQGLTTSVVDLACARHRLIQGQEPTLDMDFSDHVLDALDNLAACLTMVFPGLPRARRDGLERDPLDQLLADLGMQPGSRDTIDAAIWRRARCGDCAVPVGVRHETGCHNGQCVNTGKQHIMWCEEPDPDQCTQSVNTGYPSGTVEALAHGRRLSLVDGEWHADPNGMMPDRGYVRQHGRWNRTTERFELA